MRVFKRGLGWAFAAFSVLMTFLPESVFSKCCVIKKDLIENSQYFSWLDADGCNIALMRVAVFVGLLLISVLSVSIDCKPVNLNSRCLKYK